MRKLGSDKCEECGGKGYTIGFGVGEGLVVIKCEDKKKRCQNENN